MDNRKTLDDSHEILDRYKLLGKIKEKISGLLNKNILIISGDQTSRERIKSYLETLGFVSEKIITENSPAQIVSKVKRNPGQVDAIICPLKEINKRVTTETGFNLMKIIKDILAKNLEKQHIPFLFFENKFNSEDVISAFKAGASQFIVLPSDPVSLGQKLIEVFEVLKDPLVDHEVKKLLAEGNRLQGQGLFEDAIDFYNEGLALGGENVEILTEKAGTLLRMGEVDEGIQIYKRVVEIESNYPRAYQGLGMAYEQLGDYQEAKKNYMKVLDTEPENVQVRYCIGMICQDEGCLEKAKFHFEEGIKLRPKFVKNYLGLAKNYEALEKPEEALKIYKKGMAQNPNQTFLYVTAGDFCLKHNLNRDAEDIFSEAISINETHIHLYNRKGIALRKQDKFDEAITNFAKAIKINPDDANLRYNLAKAYYIKGEELIAVEKLKKAIELDPDLKSKFEKDQYFSKLIKKYPDQLKF